MDPRLDQALGPAQTRRGSPLLRRLPALPRRRESLTARGSCPAADRRHRSLFPRLFRAPGFNAEHTQLRPTQQPPSGTAGAAAAAPPRRSCQPGGPGEPSVLGALTRGGNAHRAARARRIPARQPGVRRRAGPSSSPRSSAPAGRGRAGHPPAGLPAPALPRQGTRMRTREGDGERRSAALLALPEPARAAGGRTPLSVLRPAAPVSGRGRGRVVGVRGAAASPRGGKAAARLGTVIAPGTSRRRQRAGAEPGASSTSTSFLRNRAPRAGDHCGLSALQQPRGEREGGSQHLADFL